MFECSYSRCKSPKDNGQHFGDHRIPAGKRQAFESDVLVPFFVRGPGIPKGTSSSQVVQSVDLGPTFLDLASSQNHLNELVKPTYPMDGKSILPLLTSNLPDTSNYNDFRWAALFEMYGGSSNIGLRYKNVTGYFKNHMVRMPEPRGRLFFVNSSFAHSTLRLLTMLFSVSKYVSGRASHKRSTRVGQ